MKLSTEDWKPIEIVDGDSSEFIAARIRHLAGDKAEKLAVIELQRAFFVARSVTIRKEPLAPEEKVVTLAYPAGRPHVVEGRFVRFGETESWRAQPSWKCMKVTTASSSIMALRERR